MKGKKIIILILLLLFLTFSSSRGVASSVNFDFYTYKGKKYSLADFKGKYVLLNLFASYCPICMVELNILNKINNRCKSKDLKIISLMIDREGLPLLPEIVSSRKLNYTVGIAPSNIFKIFPNFSILPTTYFLDQKGRVIKKITGFQPVNAWINFLKKYVSCN
jgi:thiol-disulfide isomerase/thioredoxin